MDYWSLRLIYLLLCTHISDVSRSIYTRCALQLYELLWNQEPKFKQISNDAEADQIQKEEEKKSDTEKGKERKRRQEWKKCSVNMSFRVSYCSLLFFEWYPSSSWLINFTITCSQHDPTILFTALSVQFAAINHLLFFSKSIVLSRMKKKIHLLLLNYFPLTISNW